MSESTHPVIVLMNERKRSQSQPLNRRDGAKLGIVVEGGGMRGIISAAELVRLDELGFRESIDCIYGESIGAGNAAWFIGKGLSRAIRMYDHPEIMRSFIDFKRLMIGKGPMDIQKVHEVVERDFPIDFDTVQQSGIQLNVMIANARNHGSPPLVALKDFTNKDDLMNALMPAIRPPIYSGGPLPYKDFLGWDAGIIDKFPVQQAIEDGCSHILALSCVPEGYNPKQYPHVVRMLMKAYLGRYSKQLPQYFDQVIPRLKSTLDLLREKNKVSDEPPYIATIFLPEGEKKMSSFERDIVTLKNLEKTAKQSVDQKFPS